MPTFVLKWLLEMLSLHIYDIICDNSFIFRIFYYHHVSVIVTYSQNAISLIIHYARCSVLIKCLLLHSKLADVFRSRLQGAARFTFIFCASTAWDIFQYVLDLGLLGRWSSYSEVNELKYFDPKASSKPGILTSHSFMYLSLCRVLFCLLRSYIYLKMFEVFFFFL